MIEIESCRLFQIEMPFKRSFKHSAAARSRAECLVLQTRLGDGSVGYGEAQPRSYVTGETIGSVVEATEGLAACLDFKGGGSKDLLSFLEQEILSRKNLRRDREQNSVRCLVELSLLDAFCHSVDSDLWRFLSELCPALPTPSLSEYLIYDGVVSLDTPLKMAWSATKMRLFGLKKIKIKCGSDRGAILRRVKLLRSVVGRNVDLRVDANGCWDLDTALSLTEPLGSLGITSLEQPLPTASLSGLAELTRRSKIPVMLDESVSTPTELEEVIECGAADLINIRVAKCGGIINSLRMADLARRRMQGFQIGCMVGETEVLSAAGRQLARLSPDRRYLEGSYGRFLLADRLTREDLSFRRGGVAAPLSGKGLGIEVLPARLERYSSRVIDIL